jgi:hypothetical protein
MLVWLSQLSAAVDICCAWVAAVCLYSLLYRVRLLLLLLLPNFCVHCSACCCRWYP